MSNVWVNTQQWALDGLATMVLNSSCSYTANFYIAVKIKCWKIQLMRSKLRLSCHCGDLKNHYVVPQFETMLTAIILRNKRYAFFWTNSCEHFVLQKKCLGSLKEQRKIATHTNLYVTFLWNSTCSFTFSSTAFVFNIWSLSSSDLFLQLPTNCSLGFGKPESNLLMATEKASSWRLWAYNK